MSYQVIARKYRPQKFSDVVGQEHVTQTLSNAITQNRIAHAYLFVGPRGTGKTTIARIFAKCLNCTDGPRVNFADDDPRCQEIAEGRSLDVLEIDGASNRGIEEIRELRETVKYAPATSKFKIYIIDEVHMLTKEAFNALLKTLEEPPAHVKFMFATTEPEKVLATILSRCQRFDLRRIPIPLISQHLAHIAQKEKVRIDEPALNAIARGADGGMRDAESALDQLISFCGETIVEPDVLSMFGLTARGQILALSEAILKGEAQSVLRELHQLAKSGKDLGRLLSDLLGQFRNLLIYHVSSGDLKLLEVSDEEAASLREQAGLAGGDDITRIMEVLTDAEGGYRDAASKKIYIEVALLKAIQARQAVSIDAVLKQLQDLRGTADTTAGPTSVSSAVKPAAAPVKKAAQTGSSRMSESPAAASASRNESFASPHSDVVVRAAAPTPPGAASDLAGLWQDFLEALGKVSAFTRSYFLQAHPVSFDKNIFVIGFDPEFNDQLELVNNQRTLSIAQTKLKELGYRDAHVKIVESRAPQEWTKPSVPQPAPADAVSAPVSIPPAATAVTPGGTPIAAARPSREPASPPPAHEKISHDEFKKDPLIQKALEIFKGQIVEIRV